MAKKGAKRAAAAKKKANSAKPAEDKSPSPEVQDTEAQEVEVGTGLLQQLDKFSERLQELEKRALRAAEDVSGNVSLSSLFCRPIGFIRSAFPEKTGTPRQGMLCPDVRAELAIEKNVFTNAQHSLDGLSGFSHIWLIFWFHLNGRNSVKAKVKPPRLEGNETKGVFATRSPHRPNPLGLSLVRLDRIDDGKLYVTGVDLVDGTPVLDVKPFIDPYDVPAVDGIGKPASNWVSKADSDLPSLNKVEFTSYALQKMKLYHSRCDIECEHCLRFIDETQLYGAICELLKTDLRSRYRRDKCSDRVQIVFVDNVKVTVWYDDEGNVHVLNLEPKKDSESEVEEELALKPEGGGVSARNGRKPENGHGKDLNGGLRIEAERASSEANL